MSTTITRALVKAVRNSKVLIEKLVTSTVRIHGAALDKRVAKLYAQAEDIADSAHILKAAADSRFDDAEIAFEVADDIAGDVLLEKQSLGL